MATKTQQVVIKLRTDTAANWTAANRLLQAGELGFDTTSQILKIGPGNWNDLPAITGLDAAAFVQTIGDQTVAGKKQFTGELLIGTNTDLNKNVKFVPSATNQVDLLWGDEE
jgi:hypothetical protein